MASPLDSDWSSTILSDTNLNKTTYGQGTSFPSTWSLTRLFWRTDEQKIYQNTGTEASPTWTSLSAEPPSVDPYILTYDEVIGNHTSPSGATSSSNASVDIAHTLNAPTTSMGYTNGGGQATAFALGTSPVFSPSQTSTSYSFSTTSQNWSSGRCYAEYSNDGGSTWTQFATLSANGTDSGTLVVQFNRIRIMGYRQWYQWTAYYDPTASLFYSDDVLPAHVFSGTQGTTWGEYWTSTQETNPFIYVDMGSSTFTSQVAIYHNSTDTTETEYQIQTSDNASTWTTRRTINVSDLTNDSWNFIRFNPTNARYVRVYGSSGNSLVMSIDEIKVLKGIDVTTATNIQNHGHLTISATDTTLSLEGL